jgi:hypothetical protein
MRVNRRKITTLLVVISLLAGPSLVEAEVKTVRRMMTEQEFNRLKEREGVYEEGKNYNIVIDGHGTGLRPPTEAQWRQIRMLPVVVDEIVFTRKAAPPSHDNSTTNWFPPIGSQGAEGSCVSWACCYYTKTFQEAKEYGWDLSGCTWNGEPSSGCQGHIFSPDFVYHQVNGGQDGGSTYFDNMNLMERVGCCSWEKMPYDDSDSATWPNEDAWREAPWYRSLTGYTVMYVHTDPALQDLKELLADTNLAVISIQAGFYDSLTSQDLWTVDKYNPWGTNHANTVVGYDDNYGPYQEDGDPNTYGAFKVANSWGTGGWENVPDGFYYISYECMKQRIQYIMFYENRIGYEPEMISVFQLSHSLRGECETTVGIGNMSLPDSIKPFDQYDNKGGAHPFPANNMVMDITEFMPYVSSPPEFFLEVYDGYTDTTGTIDFFSIEIYDDYASGVPIDTHVSQSPPVSTINGSSVYATTSPAIQFNRCVVDDAGGNNDGDLDPGEIAELSVTLHNLGLDATNVAGELSSDDAYLFIDITTAGYGNIPSGDEQTSLTTYRCSVAVDCPDPHVARFSLEITSDGGYSTTDSFYMGIGDTTGFSDDMESGMGGWTHQVVTFGYSDEWHQSTQRSQSGTTSWKFGDQGGGNYGDRTDGGLVTTPFLLGPGSELSFWHWMDAETDTAPTIAWDGAIVMLSVDNGDWVQILPTSGYPYTIMPNPASPFHPETPCFSGTHDWTHVEFDLSGYEGVAQIMFRFGSDGFVTEEGWYVDDVVVEGAGCGDCNDDGRVTFADALYVKNYYFQTPPGSPAPIGKGDVNLDGRVTFADALYIKNYYFQTPPGSPPPCEPPATTGSSGEKPMRK